MQVHWDGMPGRFVEKAWSLRHALMLFVVLQFLDVLSTVLALGQGAEEANPVMRILMGQEGMAAMVMAKMAVIGLVFLAIWIDPLERVYVPAAIMIANVAYALVLSNNFAAYGMGSGDWSLPVAFWALMLSVAIVAVDEAFFSRKPRPVED